MRRPVVTCVLLLAGLAGCDLARAGVRGSGKARSESRTVAGFAAVATAGAIDLEIAIGAATSVTVTGDDNIVPLIRTEVHGDQLVIDSTRPYQTRSPLRVRITTPSLTALTASGASDSTIRGVTGESLALTATGAGDIDVTGAVDQLTVTITGAGEIHARALTAARVSARITGAGELDVTATAALDATVTGAGTVRYAGAPPQVRRQVTGAGEILPL